MVQQAVPAPSASWWQLARQPPACPCQQRPLGLPQVELSG